MICDHMYVRVVLIIIILLLFSRSRLLICLLCSIGTFASGLKENGTRFIKNHHPFKRYYHHPDIIRKDTHDNVFLFVYHYCW